MNEMRRALNSRQDEILILIRARGYVSLEMLAERFGVSQQTVRRDIILLSENQMVQRYHGGAGLPAGVEGLAYANRRTRKADEKAVIGRMIAEQIPSGSSVFIDIGTTMEAVAKELITKDNLRIITNHIGIVSLFCEATEFEIILTGGLVRNRDRAITGEETVEFLNRFRVGFGIFGAGSLTREGHLLDYHYRDAQASRAAMAMARTKFVGLDHSKFEADAMMPFATVAEIDGVFSDRAPDFQTRESIESGEAKLFLP